MNRRKFLTNLAAAGVATVALPGKASSVLAEGVAEGQGPADNRGLRMPGGGYVIVSQLKGIDDVGAGEPNAYFMAMSLVKLPSGKLLAAISRGKRDPENGLFGLRMAVSSDGGKTWSVVSELPFDSCEPVMYVYGGRPYLFLTPNRPESERRTMFAKADDERIWASVSDDEGVTWSKPVAVLKGKPNYTSGGQTALLEKDGRLYWSVSNRYKEMAVVCCQLDAGILSPAAWRISPLAEMPIPREIVAGELPANPGMTCLEGNVISVGGRILMLCRAVIDRYATANLGAVYEVLDRPSGLELRFVQLYPIPGGQCKFYIQYDPKSRMYWMASNLPSNSQDLIHFEQTGLTEKAKAEGKNWNFRQDRRLLTLWYSIDALNWLPAGWIAKAASWRQSFSYPVMVIDGDDLLLIVRTSRDSGNYHDADLATFHRVENFRALALDIWPHI